MATKLQTLTTLWQEFDLTGTQKLLDELAGQITDRQDESEVSKKNLIEQMRTFKKTNSEETRLKASPLLKSFQNEVDNLNKRSKAAEKAFFDIYQKFCDIADPVPTLEYCGESMKGLHKVTDLEIEVSQLRETLATTNTELTRLKFKEKELEQAQEKLSSLEASQEEFLETKLEEHKALVNDQFIEKMKDIEEEQITAAQKLADAEARTRTAQKMLQESQAALDEVKFSQDDKRRAASDEMEILLTDLERANQRALSAEREAASLAERVVSLTSQLNLSHDQPEEQSTQEEEGLRMQLLGKEKEVATLVEDLQRNTKNMQEIEAKLSGKVSSLESKVSQLEGEKSELNSRLDKQKDYPQIKKELGILRTLEFSSQDNTALDADQSEDSRPLEVLILERSKVLQSENSMLRLDKERNIREIQELKSDLDSKTQQCTKQSQLIAQLEDHVEQLQTISTPFREEAEGRSSSDMLAEVLETQDDVFLKDASMSPVPGAHESSGTMLSIVQAQRERLRSRNEELELLNEQQLAQLQLLQGEVQHLKQDNVKLYEKIRYLQSCSGTRTSGDVVVPVESKYKSSYEQRLDPFTSFSKSERQRKYDQLSLFEKIILSLVRFVASNKNARLAVFFYAVVMHGLVFAVLYKLALTESCRHELAAEWHEKYIGHMQEVHGHGPDNPVG